MEMATLLSSAILTHVGNAAFQAAHPGMWRILQDVFVGNQDDNDHAEGKADLWLCGILLIFLLVTTLSDTGPFTCLPGSF